MTQNKTTPKTETLKDKVVSLINEVNKTHRYSMSHIYGLYNEVFTVAEVPQACASCLIRKVKQLKQWLKDQPEEEKICEDSNSRKKKKK